MQKKLTSLFKPLLKSILLIGLVVMLTFGQAGDAWAARGGGRMGGGSFRAAPSRSYSAPTRSYPSGGYARGYGGGYYPGGGFGFWAFPLLFGGGFGSLFSVLIFIAVANFLFQTFRRSVGDDLEIGSGSSTVAVAQVQVGLLSEARELQADLDRLATKADTGSTAGLAQLLQETTLALLRHPEYWVYAAGEAQQTSLAAAEAQFNRLALGERSKFTVETLSNVNSQIKRSESALAVATPGGALETQDPGEYIVVTVVVGTQGKLQLPKINSTEDLRQALKELGSVSSDRLLALEVLWTPQATGDVLTRDDMIADYANLKLI
jgi:uncharacterized membrane protein